MLPTAATRTAPFPCAHPIAAASSAEYASRPGSRGSRRPPRLMLITCAPFLTAHVIACTSASTSIRSSSFTTFATSSSAEGAIPAMPTSSTPAAISPATNVPCPARSTFAEPPTKLFAPTILSASSGCSPSMPESITATRTAGSNGSSSQKSKARFAVRCHCRSASGSVGTKARRREPSRSTYVAPGSAESRGGAARSTTTAGSGARLFTPGPSARLRAGRSAVERAPTA